MPRDFDHIQRKLTNMKVGQTEYFHSEKGDPILITKGNKPDPVGELQKALKPPARKAKTILDPSLDKTAEAGRGV